LFWPWQKTAVVMVTGAAGRRRAAEILCAHVPLLPAGGDPDGRVHRDAKPARQMVHRMARVLPYIPDATGAARLMQQHGVVQAGEAGVYVWRRAAPGERVYRAGKNGQLNLVAMFSPAGSRQEGRGGDGRAA